MRIAIRDRVRVEDFLVKNLQYFFFILEMLEKTFESEKKLKKKKDRFCSRLLRKNAFEGDQQVQRSFILPDWEVLCCPLGNGYCQPKFQIE